MQRSHKLWFRFFASVFASVFVCKLLKFHVSVWIRDKKKYYLYLKDVRAKNFYNTDFLIVWLQSDNELPMSQMQKNWGSPTSFTK